MGTEDEVRLATYEVVYIAVRSLGPVLTITPQAERERYEASCALLFMFALVVVQGH